VLGAARVFLRGEDLGAYTLPAAKRELPSILEARRAQERLG
jgi:hypothetical protein